MLQVDIIAAHFTSESWTATPSASAGSTIAHEVYALLDCPPLANCQFVLVDRLAKHADGILLIGNLDHDVRSLNLAKLRHLGANLGAALGNIDVHVFAPSPLRIH